MNSIENLLTKLQRPRYRDAFIAANIGVQIATQLRALRTNRGKSQDKLADEMDMNQATISLMEKPDYGRYNIGTLIRFAQHYKVALDIRFVSMTDYVHRVLNQTPDSMAPPPFGEPLAAPNEPEVPRAQAAGVEQDKEPSPDKFKLVQRPRKRSDQDDLSLMDLGRKLSLAEESSTGT
jgi:transcriptional regulator with XRE-family HTH domain